MDFRSNEIGGIVIQLENIKGMIITSNQALELVSLLEVVVREEQDEDYTD